MDTNTLHEIEPSYDFVTPIILSSLNNNYDVNNQYNHEYYMDILNKQATQFKELNIHEYVYNICNTHIKVSVYQHVQYCSNNTHIISTHLDEKQHNKKIKLNIHLINNKITPCVVTSNVINILLEFITNNKDYLLHNTHQINQLHNTFKATNYAYSTFLEDNILFDKIFLYFVLILNISVKHKYKLTEMPTDLIQFCINPTTFVSSKKRKNKRKSNNSKTPDNSFSKMLISMSAHDSMNMMLSNPSIKTCIDICVDNINNNENIEETNAATNKMSDLLEKLTIMHMIKKIVMDK